MTGIKHLLRSVDHRFDGDLRNDDFYFDPRMQIDLLFGATITCHTVSHTTAEDVRDGHAGDPDVHKSILEFIKFILLDHDAEFVDRDRSCKTCVTGYFDHLDRNRSLDRNRFARETGQFSLDQAICSIQLCRIELDRKTDIAVDGRHKVGIGADKTVFRNVETGKFFLTAHTQADRMFEGNKKNKCRTGSPGRRHQDTEKLDPNKMSARHAGIGQKFACCKYGGKDRSDCTADTVDADGTDRVIDEEQKLEIYKKIAAIESTEDYDDVREELKDRFGDIPAPAGNLLRIALIRSVAARIGIIEIAGTPGTIRFYMDPKAKVHAENIPSLLRNYRKNLAFSMKGFSGRGVPEFMYQYKAVGVTVRDEEILLTSVEELLVAMANKLIG